MKKYSKLPLLLAFAALTSLVTGCGTVTGGMHQSVSVKTQKDKADVAGAKCALTNSKGSWTVTTPGTVEIHRARGDLTVKCSKEDETDASLTVESSLRKGSLAGNIALVGVGTVVFQGIDSATGGAYAYPDDITVSFGEKVNSASSPVATSVPPAGAIETDAHAAAPAVASGAQAPAGPAVAPALTTSAAEQAPTTSTASTDTAPVAK